METKRKYSKPELKIQVIELGVFGEYGTDVPGGGADDPRPVKITNPYDYMID